MIFFITRNPEKSLQWPSGLEIPTAYRRTIGYVKKEAIGAIIKRNSYCGEPRLGEFLNVVRERVPEEE